MAYCTANVRYWPKAVIAIYGLVDEAFKGGQDRIQLAAFPFQMTTQNLTRHADNPNAPFWEMLKSGDDAFFVTGTQDDESRSEEVVQS